MKTRIAFPRARLVLVALAAAGAPLCGCATGTSDHAARTSGPYPLRVVRTGEPASAAGPEAAKPAAAEAPRRAPGAYPLRA